jgi:hypothetical protein
MVANGLERGQVEELSPHMNNHIHDNTPVIPTPSMEEPVMVVPTMEPKVTPIIDAPDEEKLEQEITQ